MTTTSMSTSESREADGNSATIAMDWSDLYNIIPLTFGLFQTIHTTIQNPMQTKAFPTGFPPLTLETSPNTSSTNAIAAPSLLLSGTKSIMPHTMSSTPTSSRSELEFGEEALRSWTICSDVIGELSLATPADSTVKDRMRAERRETIETNDMVM